MKYSHSLTASVTAHLLLVFFVCYQLNMATPVKYGNNEREIISSYLISTPAVVADAKPESKQLITPITKHAIALQIKNKVANKMAKQTEAHQRSAIKGAPMPELIALLHAAIQKAQHYPASAQEMEREGRTTVAFTLHKNGSISDLQIQHSSGTSSLDNAALAAVSDAAPFPQVDRYVRTAQAYQIDVVFAL